MKKPLSGLLAAGLAGLMLALAACAAAPPRHQYTAQFLNLFDTVTTIIGYGATEEEFTALAQDIHDDLEQYHQLYDVYNDYEGVVNLKTVNDRAGTAPVKVDGELMAMLQYAKQQTLATGGAFNVAYGAVLRLWHDHRAAAIDDPTAASLPTLAELQEAARHTDIDDLVLDETNSTVFFRDPDMRLDVGAVAKGYAVEQAARHLEEQGIDALLLSVGGNVRAIGQKHTDTGDTPWVVSIPNPDKDSEEQSLMRLNVDNTSVVSSGGYERYYTVDGKRYHHIIDPATLFPSDRYAAVTVVCPDSGEADALSTALFNLPLEEGLALVNSRPELQALWVLPDGSLRMSDGFEALVRPAD